MFIDGLFCNYVFIATNVCFTGTAMAMYISNLTMWQQLQSVSVLWKVDGLQEGQSQSLTWYATTSSGPNLCFVTFQNECSDAFRFRIFRDVLYHYFCLNLQIYIYFMILGLINFFVFYYFAATTRLRSKIWTWCLNPISSFVCPLQVGCAFYYRFTSRS